MLFETGYGPSGLPHIGTFQEVLRTTLVRRAYEMLTGGAPTRLVAFSDDMDGLRKVPDNVPNPDLLTAHLGHPLSRIPDPFGTHESFAAHNNAMLREFLDRFGFDYEFVSASERYNSGAFDDALRNVLAHYDAILAIMLPTLREERAQTYSPVLPVIPRAARCCRCRSTRSMPKRAPSRYLDPATARTAHQSILGGQAKLQWKVDWAMRWVALGVDYEMCGKDLTDSVTQSGRIASVLGGRKPEGLIYELFLDENGEKISKSKGNGLTIDEWLTYGSEESLGFYLYREPKSAKSLHIGVIPRAVDEYWQFADKLADQPVEQQLGNPVWHLLRAGARARRRHAAGDLRPAAQPGRRAGRRGDARAGVVLSRQLRRPMPAPPRTPRSMRWSAARWPTTAISSPRRCSAARPRRTKRRRSPRSTTRWPDSDESATAEDLQTLVYEIGKDPALRLREPARLVQGAVRDAARIEPGPAHGQLHRALRRRQHPHADRGGAGGRPRAGMKSDRNAEALAEELLGRPFCDLDEEEQRVLRARSSRAN